MTNVYKEKYLKNKAYSLIYIAGVSVKDGYKNKKRQYFKKRVM